MNVKIKIGCDVVKISRFKNLNQNLTLSKLFSKYELLNNKSYESLAGVFAVKEAILKALELKPGNWTDIEILKQENGKPFVKLLGYNKKILSSDISISHEDDYAFATCSFLIQENKNDIK